MCASNLQTHIASRNNDLPAIELLKDGGHDPVVSVQDLIRTAIDANKHVIGSFVTIRHTSLYPECRLWALQVSRLEHYLRGELDVS